MAGRLFYFLFVAAMLLAVGLGSLENESLKKTLLPAYPILLGLSMICLAQQAMVDDHIFRRRYTIVKSEHPIGFWGIVVFYYLCGGILLISGIWLWL